ncbi:Alginate biosynthesis sensor protein KinB [bioreactor metagenome]|uniref:histidine kinase n=1 Tax=bioreactor metagenome TaxID=1076179 RepID=A0A644ZJI4_9ZZZZ
MIQGYADLLKGDMLTDPEVRAEYLGRISDKVMYLNELLGQLLLEARAEAGIPSLRLERFDLCTLARQTAAEISPAARMMDISVSVTCAEEQIPVTADQSLLRKVIYNILGNSLKYMNRSGSINITVSRADEQALLIFKDDGLGMDAQEAEHVFELSYQGSNKKSGDGFGLYYAKSGIQAHGGAIQAKSAPGQGMGIYITLPAMGPAQQEPEPEPEGLRESLEIIST